MILAAGTVLVRKTTHWQVLIIHRHDRNDWSLPKGKAEVGENLAIAAVRETAEETGYQVQLRTPLTKVNYLHGDTQKSVNYWLATEVSHDQTTVPNDEVDEIRWVSLSEASQLLTYPRDIKVVAEAFGLVDAQSSTILIVRHANSTKRETFTGDDLDRPLSELGFKQLAELSQILQAYGVREVVSSPALRCVQTVEPYALFQNIPVKSNDLLLEDQPSFNRAAWINLSKNNQPMAVCSHRPVIDLIGTFELDAQDLLTNLEPAGVVVLHRLANSELLACELHLI